MIRRIIGDAAFEARRERDDPQRGLINNRTRARARVRMRLIRREIFISFSFRASFRLLKPRRRHAARCEAE